MDSNVSVQINLRVIRRSRKLPRAGDVFAMQVPDERYLFGRVIAADLPSGRAPMPDAHLLYIYNTLRKDKAVDPQGLRPSELLLPPVFTNSMGWTRGHFETLTNQPLKVDDLLEQHCFWDVLREEYVDEYMNVLPGRAEPCGLWGLGSYRAIDDMISDALGIPRVPVDPDDLPGSARQNPPPKPRSNG